MKHSTPYVKVLDGELANYRYGGAIDSDGGWPDTMSQWAPFPTELGELVESLRLEPGWDIYLADMQRDEDHGRGSAGGLSLVISTLTYDSYHPEHGRTYRVNHIIPVPAATFNRQSWQRWILDRYVAILTHEATEFFQVNTAAPGEEPRWERPFAPTHGPGDDPYVIHEYAADVQRRTRFTGEIKNEA